MMKKSYVLYVILSLAGLLLATDAVQAHGGRRGCGGGGYSGCYGGSSYGCHGGYAYGGCYGGGYSYGGCHGRYAYGGCHGRHSHGGCYGGYAYGGCHGGYAHGGHAYSGCHGGYAHGGCYGSSYGHGGHHSGGHAYVNGSYPGTYVLNPNGVGSVFAGSPSESSARLSFFQPEGDTNDGGQAIQNNAARIRVMVSNPQARVFIDGQQTNSTGLVRMFHTPELTADGSYRIRVTWTEDGREVTKERTVAVSPGQTAVVDLGQARAGAEEAQEFQPGTTPAAEGTPIRVIVPDAQATVWINDRKMSATGTTRSLNAPAVRAGDPNSYRVRASWTKDGQVVTQERTVSPTAGQSSVVDFTRPEADRTPPRQQEQ